MKLAHLILTHANPAQLDRLINRLDHADSHFYVHLDKKTDIQPFLYLADKGNVFFVLNRVKVYWGGFSIVEATVNGFEEIINTGIAYDHINLLSGQDYPLKSTEHIHSFLAQNKGKIFMHTESIEDEWHEALPRIRNYHLAHYRIPRGTYQLEKVVNAIMPTRKLPDGIVPVGRSQWFTATRNSIEYIVNYMRTEPWISKFFRLSWASDEIVFQTILYNSPFKEYMVNDNLVYLDWSAAAASPKVLTMEDAENLRTTDKLFARKFNSSVDSRILDYIDDISA